MRRHDWFFLGSIFYGFWAFDVVLPRLLMTFNSLTFLLAILYGIAFGQIHLIGAWGALAPGKVVVRLPWTVLLGVLMWHAILIGRRMELSVDGSEHLMVGFVAAFGIVATLVPLWVARHRFRWRLLPPKFRLEDLAEADTRFNLKQIFLGMFLVSIALGLARLSLPDFDSNAVFLNRELAKALPVLAIFNAVIALPVIWMAFRQGRLQVVWALAWIPYALVLSVCEVHVLQRFVSSPTGASAVYSIRLYALNLSQCMTVFITLLLLRWLNFKLVRADPESW